MISLLLAVIYLAFISLGLPDAILGSAWPNMYRSLNSTITGAGSIFLITIKYLCKRKSELKSIKHRKREKAISSSHIEQYIL